MIHMNEVTDKLTVYCAQHPNVELMTAAEDIVEK